MKMRARWFLLALVAAGCSSTPEEQPKDTPRDPDWREAEGAYLSGDWGRAISAYQRFLGANPRDERRFAAKLRIGRAQLAQDRPASALPYFDEVLNSPAEEDVLADAHAARGAVFHAIGSPDKAETEFLKAISQGGSLVRRDECLFYLGVSRIRQGRWDEGLSDMNLMLREAPDSPFAPKARALRASTDRTFQVQAGAFADPAGARRRSDALRIAGVEPALTPEGALTCVRFGRFTTWREAQNEAERVGRLVGCDATVVP